MLAWPYAGELAASDVTATAATRTGVNRDILNVSPPYRVGLAPRSRYGQKMAFETEAVEFHRDESEPVVAAMVELADRGDGEGWINIGPLLDEDQQRRVPERSGLAAWFSGRGPAVALATWTPPATGRKPRLAQLGVAHGTGPDALKRLDELGLGLPAGWVKRQDHAKHGIVVDLPHSADPAAIVRWLIAASTVLRTIVEPGTTWGAEIYRPGST